MSIHLQSMAWKFDLSCIKSRQKSSVKLVLIKLCDNASDEGYCWPSMGRIAKECELSRRSVVDQINKLKDVGLIEVTHRFKGNEQTSNGYQINIALLERGELNAPPSEPNSPHQCTEFTQNHHRTTNESSNTDIFSGKQKEMSTLFDIADVRDRFPMCLEAIFVLDDCKRRGEDVYTGKLSIDEWEMCEDAMNSVDEFDIDSYFTWWLECRAKAMRKTPSLPNMLCEFDKTEATFADFYHDAFMQECDL